MRVGIHQPMYLPWCGFFDRISKCDVFVLLDNVQYSKNYFINRNKIKTPSGWSWITIPVLTHGKLNQLIKDVEVDQKILWEKQHWKNIFFSYSKALFFSEHANFFRDLYAERYFRLEDVIERSLTYLLKSLDISTKIIRVSDLEISGKKNDYILNICKNLGADQYLSGPDGRNYLNLGQWQDAQIEVLFHDYHHPVYPQLYGNFEPNMSVIDLLFNCGTKSREILTLDQPKYPNRKPGGNEI